MPLSQPEISVGKASSVVNAAPPALRFWSKLGLSPRSGEKDVLTFVLYEEGSNLSHCAEAWLRRVSAAYKVSVLKLVTDLPLIHSVVERIRLTRH